MALRDLTDQSAVFEAIAEAKHVGEPAFLDKYGFQSTFHSFRHTFSKRALENGRQIT